MELKGTAMAWKVQSFEFHLQYQRKRARKRRREGEREARGRREEGGRKRKKNACILREGNSDFRSHRKKKGKKQGPACLLTSFQVQHTFTLRDTHMHTPLALFTGRLAGQQQ